MSRVLTMPGFGAFAIMTKVRFEGGKHTVVWLEDSMRELSIGTYAIAAFPPFDVENNSSLSGSR
jgi:hypothetical protein